MSEEVVHINVGGIYFSSRRSTLLHSNTFFAGALRAQPDCYELFVDRDPTHFRHVLNWIRGVRHLPEDESVLQELSWEADYYCMPDLHEAIANAKTRVSLHKVLAGILQELRLATRT